MAMRLNESRHDAAVAEVDGFGVGTTKPATGLGKPDKKAVRAQFWEGAGRAVG
jgi:hypothetical protein